MGEIQQGGSHLKILPQQDGNPATGRVLRPSRLKKNRQPPGFIASLGQGAL